MTLVLTYHNMELCPTYRGAITASRKALLSRDPMVNPLDAMTRYIRLIGQNMRWLLNVPARGERIPSRRNIMVYDGYQRQDVHFQDLQALGRTRYSLNAARLLRPVGAWNDFQPSQPSVRFLNDPTMADKRDKKTNTEYEFLDTSNTASTDDSGNYEDVSSDDSEESEDSQYTVLDSCGNGASAYSDSDSDVDTTASTVGTDENNNLQEEERNQPTLQSVADRIAARCPTPYSPTDSPTPSTSASRASTPGPSTSTGATAPLPLKKRIVNNAATDSDAIYNLPSRIPIRHYSGPTKLEATKNPMTVLLAGSLTTALNLFSAVVPIQHQTSCPLGEAQITATTVGCQLKRVDAYCLSCSGHFSFHFGE